MRNYIRADVKRILRRSSHLFSMLLVFALYVTTLCLTNRGPQVTAVNLVTSTCSMLDWLVVIIGLFEMIAVFSEDFKVKTMQIAIGLGISRNKVVLCKLLEAAILLALDCVVIALLTQATGLVMGVTIPMSAMVDVIYALAIKCLLAQVAALSLTMIVLFVTQSSILSIFVFTFISVDVVNLALSILPMFGVTWIESLNLTRFTLSYLIGSLYTRAILGGFALSAFIGVAIYIGLGIFGTCKLFSKRELDF